ncbi:hypothetical protein DOTSEDRAFT_57352 [Dothistroma septosporum NZE10]|uniref:Methyltransferase domain-containing protein n=1 Tax=Dothistroma septosporum (strain NZE10 / CBS 128990) TaxID=675120 RepID=M2Y1A8_DOTSN|nr:hypothetical protein DOTSEDRAFT_57352 [Dothistroma septosporum NZE10]
MASTAPSRLFQDVAASGVKHEYRPYQDDPSSNYVLPKDTKEHCRLEGQAQALETLMGGEVLHAPVDVAKVKKVLDIGCGTGVVTDKLAQRFPKADVYGLDLSPVPKVREQRPNVRYIQGNAVTQRPTNWSGTQEPAITEDEAVFDYIFSRLLIAGITDWNGLLAHEFAMLKPGGYLEHHEVDSTSFDANGHELPNVLKDRAGLLHLDPRAGRKMKERMEDVGFVDVMEVKYRLPLGGALETDPAMQDVGDFWYRDICEVFTATAYGVARKLGKPIEYATAEIDKFLASRKPNVGSYTMIYAVYGRKPE